MFKKSLILSLSVFLLMSCYPLGTFQGPEVLPLGTETMGVGLSWMTNIASLQDSSSGNEKAFVADGSLLFRRGFPHNTEIGIKFTGRPWSSGAILSDVKWQIVQEPLMVAVDFGISYWTNIDILASVGYHPALIVGNGKLFGVLQYNNIRSSARILITQDLLLGHHFPMKENDYIFSPLFGLHRDEADPGNIFYSLGFGFTGPVDEWWRP
ncbi:MAG: hypothetical protein HQ556_04985 [Candidatus Marinimicrobia bacterium]|nr:hypothetical protein [Candidatus Neomarinimicrobiota bacterium]